MAEPEGPLAPPITEGAPDVVAPQGPPALLAPQAPNMLQAIQVLQQLVLHMLSLNWAHFKPKFSREPGEDTDAHLLRVNDWADTHRFQDNDKVQTFCLTLT